MSVLKKIFGDPNKKTLSRLQKIVDAVNVEEAQVQQWPEDQFPKAIQEFRERIARGEQLDQLLPKVFAVVREAGKRVMKQRHFDVQILGGVALHEGKIAEMKTGEGKTLTSTLAVVLNALTGKGVHVVTVNDYLGRRDADWMGRIYNFLGLSIGCIQHEAAFRFDPKSATEAGEESSFKVDMQNLRPITRREAYACDITYGTNNEFGFDYLRDHMVQDLEQKVQRELHYAIVDEVDSILIDEARTPLIISAPSEEATERYSQINVLVQQLKENEDYNVDEKMRAATLTEVGIRKMEKMLNVENIYEERGMREVHLIEQALKANSLFLRDRDYVVKDGEIVIVDEFTGRLMFGRRYSEGLHQSIEAKEGVEIKQESRTLATITFQNYFRLYQKLAGMTGTAATEAEEFIKIYGLDVVEIPTNQAMIREDRPDIVYKTEKAKFQAVMTKIKELHAKGQPVLVGTISIQRNELLGELLHREGVPYQLLNAKNHEREAEIIAQAGKAGAVTIATNMAGRGVDIVLGGNPKNSEKAQKVLEAGGLTVLGTERHESRRIDNQLRGRSGRQGDPGFSQFFVSLEDDLMRIFGSDRMKKMMTSLGIGDDMPIENKLFSRAIESAQKKVEGLHFDARKHVVEYDDVMNKHREVIYQKRDDILRLAKEKPEGLKEKLLDMVEQELEHVVSFHTVMNGDRPASQGQGKSLGDWNPKEIIETVRSIFPLSTSAEQQLTTMSSSTTDKKADVELRTKIIELLMEEAKAAYQKLEQRMPEPTWMRQIEKGVLLRAIDTLWIDHLDQMTYLREGIGLRGYAQQDPLVEYKRESYQLFVQLNDDIQREVVYSIYKVGDAHALAPSISSKNIIVNAPSKTMENGESEIMRLARNLAAQQPGTVGSGGATLGTQSGEQSSGIPGMIAFKAKEKDASGHKLGRNDPCFCGSGKKYKRCHGA